MGSTVSLNFGATRGVFEGGNRWGFEEEKEEEEEVRI